MQAFITENMVFIECLPSDFLMPFITKSWMKLPMLSLCCLCVVILHGLREDWKEEADKKLLADNEQAKSDEEISCIFTTPQALLQFPE